MTNSTQTSPAPEVTTRTVGTGDDLIHVDVHGDLAAASAERPVLVMFGSPMDASGFGSLAARFTDRPVVTFDPRGAGRNPTGTSPVTPEQHAEDLHRVITSLEVGPVDLLASSGGAVNALALAQAHPEDVRRLVAHEPPTAIGLPDEDVLLAACQDLADTYAAAGQGPAMARFITLVMHDGPLPADWGRRPRTRPRDVRAADGGRRRPDRAALPQRPRLQRLRGRRGPAASPRRPRRRRGRCRVRADHGRARRAAGRGHAGSAGHGLPGRPRRLPRR